MTYYYKQTRHNYDNLRFELNMIDVSGLIEFAIGSGF